MQAGLRHALDRHGHAVVLAALLLWFLLEPFALGSAALEALSLAALLLIATLGPWLITRYRFLLLWPAALAAAFLLRRLPFVATAAAPGTLLSLLVIVFTLITVGALLHHAVTAAPRLREAILTTLIAYLLIGVFFAALFEAVHDLEPASFSPPIAAEQSVLEELDTFLYFSFATLTTVGYGDLAPAAPLARRLSSLEAAVGVLYVAIFIGSILGGRRA